MTFKTERQSEKERKKYFLQYNQSHTTNTSEGKKN